MITIKKMSITISLIALYMITVNGCENKTDNVTGIDNLPDITGYPIVGTDQTIFFNNYAIIDAPLEGEVFYGQNAYYPGSVPRYENNNDGTVTDMVTGLMWQQSCDINGDGVVNADDKMSQPDAAAGAEDFDLAGHNAWRLPDTKELQSIVDYTRSPATTNSAAIDPLFNCTGIVNEAGQADFPCYWTSTTHENWTANNQGSFAVYVYFGRAMGYMVDSWMDVHGAGAQRSDPKTGDPEDYPEGNGPQGDAIRIYNYVRLVRNIQ